jgi:hypothetical protein
MPESQPVEVLVTARRTRPVLTLIAALVVAAVLTPAGLAGPRADGQPAFPTLYVKYTMNCTFTIEDDAGRRVTSIAPGTYQIEVSTPVMFKLVVPGGAGVDHLAPGDMTGCRGWVQFQLQGPGVDLFTTLDAGCDAFLLLPAQTFRANSAYTAQDLNQPGVTRTTLTTQASGAPTAPQSPYGPTSGKGTVVEDLVGSDIETVRKAVPVAGTLNGGVSTKGALSLKLKGKPVSSLKSGRYRIVVLDETAKSEFTLQQLGKKPVKLTALPFVGRKTVTVRLAPGQWKYYSGNGKAQFFKVVG